MLGCAKVSKSSNDTQEDSSSQVVVMYPFNYSGEIIISKSDCEIKKNVEICSVKKLSPKSQWYKKQEKMLSTKIVPFT